MQVFSELKKLSAQINERKDEIASFIIKELVEPYRRLCENRDKDITVDTEPGYWFGLQQTKFESLDERTSTYKSTFIMNDNVCDTLRIPHGSECEAITVGASVVAAFVFDIDHGQHTLAELDAVIGQLSHLQLAVVLATSLTTPPKYIYY